MFSYVYVDLTVTEKLFSLLPLVAAPLDSNQVTHVKAYSCGKHFPGKHFPRGKQNCEHKYSQIFRDNIRVDLGSYQWGGGRRAFDTQLGRHVWHVGRKIIRL